VIKAIIFDFDGVVFNSESIHWKACNIVFNEIGFLVPYDQYLKKYVGLADVEMFPLILADYEYDYSHLEIRKFITQKIAAYENVINSSADLKGINGISEFLESSHKTISKFAICSGSTRTELNTTLSKIENGSLKKYFELITTSEDVSQGKPSPEGYLKTAKKLNVAPENCLVIEDTKNGILAAKKAEMKVIGITTTNPREVLMDAELIVNNYSEINLSDLN